MKPKKTGAADLVSTITVLSMGAMLFVLLMTPLVAKADPDELDETTIEVIDIDDNESRGVVGHHVEIPHVEDMEEKHEHHGDDNEHEGAESDLDSETGDGMAGQDDGTGSMEGMSMDSMK